MEKSGFSSVLEFSAVEFLEKCLESVGFFWLILKTTKTSSLGQRLDWWRFYFFQTDYNPENQFLALPGKERSHR